MALGSIGKVRLNRGVLNALRHLRLWHKKATDSASTLSSAQRLAASKVMAHQDLLLERDFPKRAQRLAASKVMALPAGQTLGPKAYCAQRLAASKVMAHQRPLSTAGDLLCSTPCGI